MRHLSARRLASACILPAAAVAALVAPGAASASLGTQCSGSPIGGQGSSLQKLAQEVWVPGFTTSADKYACNGTQGSKGSPKLFAYNPSGSGAGLKSWGVGKAEHKYEATNGYVGTDEPPNPTEKEEIEDNQSIEPHLTKTLQTVPVIQAAVSIIVHLPTGCTATSTSNKGRLVLDNTTLEGIYRGTIKTWGALKEGGDKLTPSTCESDAITPVVRFDGSGTTHIFKKYLGLIYAGTFETEKSESKTWEAISEGPENTTWPKAAGVIRPAEKGGSKLAALVAATPGTIGYVNVAEARANPAFIPAPVGTGGPKTATFWAPLQDNGVVSEGEKYADPANNKDVDALDESNCSKEEYTNGEVAFPPANVEESWFEVTTRTTEPKYTLCGLSYDLALTKYSQYPLTSKEEATTAENFLSFVLDTSSAGGGQFLIKKHDYEPLVGTVLKEAQSGVRGVKGKGGTEF
jgi:ABC-type phosphate transport system substrate-binding protein